MDATTTIGVVAHYNLLERLEPAGPGELYRARDTRHGRTVIVRVLPPSGSAETDRALVERVRALAALSHPNAITLFAAGDHDGRVFIAFERITGRSLRAEMAARPMQARRAVELAIQVADAVAESHAIGVHHHGLSLDSIGITAKGHAKIPAFPLATTLGFEAGSIGTLVDYGSPEEAAGEQGDERSDVYSIGAVLYELLTARRPMHKGASAPSTSNARVPRELDAVVLKAVAPNPARRYSGAAELVAALREVLPRLEVQALPAPAETTGLNPGRIALTTILILAGLTAIAWWILRP